MEYFLALIKTYFGSGEASSIVFVLFATLAVFIIIFAIGMLVLASQSPVRKRLRNLGDADLLSGIEIRNLNMNNTSGSSYLDSFDKYLSPQNESERQEIRQKLQHAGFYNKAALQNFYAIKALLTLSLPAFTLFLVRFDPTISTSSAFFYTILAAAVGMFGPNIILDRLLNRRQKTLRNALPDVLDLLVVCVESGMGLDAAINRVSESLDISHPELTYELKLVTASMRAGISRNEALNNMVERTGLKDIKGLVGVIDQSMRFGTSVADSLRVYSEEFRDKRMQEAEEKAAKIATKMIFPMILCIWPSFFIVAGGPAFLTLTDALTKIALGD